jgi:acetoin utilization deacetylase AcuC-like enzyme
VKKVGVFYHPAFNSQGYLTLRNRLRDFPGALHEVLKNPNVRLYECPRVDLELVLKVHAPEMAALVEREGSCHTAFESVGGVVAAMEALAKGELDRAFCFVGTGGHHAGYQEFWNYSCLNDVVIALTHVREISAWRRFAIVNTDAHHGGGTLQLLQERPEVLHLCFCRSNYHSLSGTQVEINVYRDLKLPDADAAYVELVRRHLPLIREFRPHLLVWYFGYDTHKDEADSLGLTEAAYVGICDLLLSLSLQAGIPLQVVLGGGSLHHVATSVIPQIIRRLGEI